MTATTITPGFLQTRTGALASFIALALFGGVLGCAKATPRTAPPIDVASLQPLNAAESVELPDSSLAWFDARLLPIEGRAFDDTATYYERLPVRAVGNVSDTALWVSKHTSGFAYRFVTDSPEIGASWDGGGAMNHMAATGNSGLDLYKRLPNGEWEFCAVGRPNTERTTKTLAKNLATEPTEYLLYLPLYQTVSQLQIGVQPGSLLAAAPPRPAGEKPLVFLGTSITQGGCASRAGMSHPAILGRWFDREVYNLGFSGSGRMEPIMAELLGEIDASAYFLECLPNMDAEMVAERIEPFVHRLRELRPTTPIVLVESPLEGDRADNIELLKIYNNLIRDKVPNIYWLPGAGQLDGPENATVDGVHPTDLGFYRMAVAYKPMVAKVLAAN
ncbi:MAG: hypothetical protein PWP23_437 [Candidatus Sumerlaeota bacterium]|nr:hypothetical protein [Candidatus Sumerlaeota bacterium]